MYTHTRLRVYAWMFGASCPCRTAAAYLVGRAGWAGLRYMRAHGDSPGVWRLQDAASRRCQTTVPRAGVIGGHQLSEA